MILFGDKLNKSLSEGLASEFKTPLFFPDITVFPDGERRVRLNDIVVGQDVTFLKTSSVTSNIDSFIIETAFLIDAIKRSGAEKIIGIIPYIPYSRADHIFRDGEAVPLEVVISMLEKAGLDRIIFVDPHTIKMPEMFSIEVVNLSALGLFAEKIKEIGFHKDSSVIVSPDMGGLRRMEQLSEMLEGLSFVSIEKERNYESGNLSVSKVHGEIKKTCFIIDDIISSGKTIAQAVEKLIELGAEKVYVFATHPIFAGDAVSLLQNSKIDKVYVTDSLPVPEAKRFEKLEVLGLSHILSQVVSE